MGYLHKSPIAGMVKRLAAIFGFHQPPPELPSCIDEQQQSPLRFRFDAVVEEYRMVWENIQKLLSNQQNLVNYTITLIAGLLALSQILRGDQPLDEFAVRYRSVYPFISILFSAFSLMYMEHDAAMAHLGMYSDQYLKPAIEDILKQIGSNLPVWRWNSIRSKWEFHNGFSRFFHYVMSSSRYAISIGPALGFAILYWSIAASADPGTIPTWEIMCSVMSALIILWVLATAAYIGRLYLRMYQPHLSQRTPAA